MTNPTPAERQTLHLALHEYAAQGQTQELQAALAAGASAYLRVVSPGTGMPRTALDVAFDNGHLDCVHALIVTAPDTLNSRNWMGDDAILLLTTAIEHDHLPLFRSLLARTPANIFAIHKETVLTLVARGGGLQCLREVLDLGRAVEEPNARDESALQLAAEYNHPHCVRLLIPSLQAALVKRAASTVSAPASQSSSTIKPKRGSRHPSLAFLREATRALEAASKAQAWPCVDLLAFHVSPLLASSVFRQAGPTAMPQWAAHVERQALGEALGAPNTPAPLASPPTPRRL